MKQNLPEINRKTRICSLLMTVCLLIFICSCTDDETYSPADDENTAYQPTVGEVDNLMTEIMNSPIISLFNEGLIPPIEDCKSAPVSTSHRTGSGKFSDTLSWSWNYTQVCMGSCYETWNFISALLIEMELDCDYSIKTGSNKTITIVNSDTTWVTTLDLNGGAITKIVLTTETENASPVISANGYDY